jgi:hypothetical protein
MEGIEDGVDRLDERLAALAAVGGLDERLGAIEQRLDQIAADMARASRPASASRARPKPKPKPAAG